MKPPDGIAWRDWSAQSFQTAQAEDKPILLSISAVWCHWCHVMDRTTYSDPRIIAAINERFVPIRVDNDQRPDVNARYNQGGWPTTAFLSPAGSLLTGATYMPAEQMIEALGRVADFYAQNRGQIDDRARELRSEQKPAPAAGELRASMVARVCEEISDAYDPEYGGFGFDQKFPMTDVLDFLLQEYRVTGEQRLYDMLARTLNGMARGGMYDHVEGGFFRYSTTRDWSVPHFEKMTEDHAALLRILAQLVRSTRSTEFRETLVSALGYVRETLADPRTNLFAGSQDADEEYYALPLQERKKRMAPYVDRTSYSNWTASMARAFAHAGYALDDDSLVRKAEATLEALNDRMRDEQGLLYHFVEPQGSPQVRGLLTDQAAYLGALIDVHEFGGESRFLDRAKILATAIEQRFAAPGGGFYDRIATDELGSLARRDRPLPENCSIAENFFRLAVLLDDADLRRQSLQTLARFAATYGKLGLFAAPFAKAVRRSLQEPSSAILVGTPEETADMREAAHALPDPLLCIRTIDPKADAALARRFDPKLHPAAYLCRQQTCAAPARDASQLRDAYESLSAAG